MLPYKHRLSEFRPINLAQVRASWTDCGPIGTASMERLMHYNHHEGLNDYSVHSRQKRKQDIGSRVHLLRL